MIMIMIMISAFVVVRLRLSSSCKIIARLFLWCTLLQLAMTMTFEKQVITHMVFYVCLSITD
jgi:hypothetical protein